MNRACRPLAGLACAGVALLATRPAAGAAGVDFTLPVRSQGLGGAAIGLPGDPTLVWRDPVAGAGQDGWTVSAGGARTFAGASIWHGLYAMPLGRRRMAAAITGYTYGDVLLRADDGTERKVAGRQDLAALVNVATPVRGLIDAGCSVTMLGSWLLDAATARSIAVDLGLGVAAGAGVTAGLALRNLGSSLRYLSDDVPLDRVLDAGAARVWRLPDGVDATMVAVAGVQWRMAERAAVGRAGIEVRWRNLLALRAGWHRGRAREIGEFGFGLGVRHRGLRLDAGVQASGAFDLPMGVSLTWFADGPGHVPTGPAAPAAGGSAPVKTVLAPVPVSSTSAVEPAAGMPSRPYREPLTFFPASDRVLRIPVAIDRSCEFAVDLADGDGVVLANLEPRHPVTAGGREAVWDGTLGGAQVMRQRTYIIRITACDQTIDYSVIVKDHE